LLLHMAQHDVVTTDTAAVFRQAEASCGNARTIEPQAGVSYQLYSDALRAWAGVQVINGRSPGDAYDRAFEMGQRALALSREPLEALLGLADTRMDKAWWQSKADIDPTAAVYEAVALYEKALAIDPRNLTGANNMGQAFVLLSRYQLAHGVDARASYERAAVSFERALDIDPTLAMAKRNLAKLADLRARVTDQTR
jgi:tetratricopeptide (TPR) repeat protein